MMPARRPGLRATLILAALLSVVACGATSGDGEGVPSDALTRIVVATGYCGAPPGCRGGSVAVDFSTSTMSTHGCSGPNGEGGDPTTRSRALTAPELERVRNALGAVRVESQPITDQDGFQQRLTIVRGAETVEYNYPNARCGGSSMKNVVAGWSELTNALPAE